MFKEKMHKFLNYQFDRVTDVLVFGGIIIMLETDVWRRQKGYFYTYIFILGMVMTISGFAYKYLVYDKKKRK